MPFSITQIPAQVSTAMEQRGTKEKFWYKDLENGKAFLFKVGRQNTGENWAEKVASELCDALDIPHASYELAHNGIHQGVISESFVPEGFRLALGNELLTRSIDGYDGEKKYHSRQHTLRLVETYIDTKKLNIQLPNGWKAPAGIQKPSEVFVGYLMLDALISNQDRHHENWGLVVSDTDLFLTPSFDHAASLGMNETDATRESKLRTSDEGNSIDQYVARARSALYQSTSSKKPLKTIEAFMRAAQNNKAAATHWLQMLDNLTNERIYEIIDCLPDEFAGALEKEFALAVIIANKKRIMSLREDLGL